MPFRLAFFNAPIYSADNIQPSTAAFQGKNAKGILIISRNFANAELQDFLSKIMKAVNADLLQDSAIWDVDALGIEPWAGLKKLTAAKKAIFFGISPEELNLHIKFPQYKCVEWNGCNFLMADDLKAIFEDKQKKQLLWRELQIMFPDKA